MDRTQKIEGYRIQPMLPMGFPYFGIQIIEGEFRKYPSEPGTWYVEVRARIGTLHHPYTLVLSIAQALTADVIEKV